MKKICLSFILFMFVMVFHTNIVFADTTWQDSFDSSISSEHIIITKYNGTDSEVVVPQTAEISGITYNTVVTGEVFSGADVNKITFEDVIFSGSVSGMFQGSTVKEIDFRNSTTDDVTDFSGMCYLCQDLKDINLSSFFEISETAGYENMFAVNEEQILRIKGIMSPTFNKKIIPKLQEWNRYIGLVDINASVEYDIAEKKVPSGKYTYTLLDKNEDELGSVTNSDGDILFSDIKVYDYGKHSYKVVQVNPEKELTKDVSFVISEGTGRITEYIPGLYDVDDNLIKDWDTLLEEGLIDVSGTTMNKVVDKSMAGKLVVSFDIETIKNACFENCSQLIGITLPSRITKINSS